MLKKRKDQDRRSISRRRETRELIEVEIKKQIQRAEKRFATQHRK